MPLADCYLILIAMWADGGHMSVAYVLLLSPIFGNGLRYGSFILRYCQILAISTLLSACLINIYSLNLPIDWVGLSAELIGILYISIYGYSLITANESISQARQQAEDSASRLIAEMPQPAFTYHIKDTDTPILYANPAMFMITAEKPADLIGKPITRLVIEEDRDALVDAALNHNIGKTQQCYVRLSNQKGDNIQVMCEMRRTIQSGQEIGLAYLTDISESERLQGELADAQKQAHTAALAAGIAHDFRNLLSGIIGHAELIQMEHKDPQLQQDIAQIIKSGNQGSEMVEQLLLLGRSNRPNAKVQQIGASINRMIQLARVQLPPDIQLSISMDHDLPTVRVNIAQIEQVLLNLVNNAAQAMQDNKGHIKICLSRHSTDADKSKLRISIQDDGCGIEADYLKSIFKPFWSTRKASGGTGLGLAMVQRIIRWHDGQIDVESVPGQGTVFNIYLPADAGEHHNGHEFIATTEIQAYTQETDMQPWRILLVEDQLDVMHIHKVFLSKMGHQVHTAENGKAALSIFLQHSFDMVLTDYMMPKMDGIALTKAIRLHNSTLPVTVATAFSEDEALSQINVPNTYVMNKPLSFKQLSTHVQWLQQSSSP